MDPDPTLYLESKFLGMQNPDFLGSSPGQNLRPPNLGSGPSSKLKSGSYSGFAQVPSSETGWTPL